MAKDHQDPRQLFARTSIPIPGQRLASLKRRFAEQVGEDNPERGMYRAEFTADEGNANSEVFNGETIKKLLMAAGVEEAAIRVEKKKHVAVVTIVKDDYDKLVAYINEQTKFKPGGSRGV